MDANEFCNSKLRDVTYMRETQKLVEYIIN